ncbi:MAG: ATP-binding protein [Ignavibacteriae bacterium]|nr:ATP-binding protein [Ignavibacteriota bacterium]
MNNIAWEDNLLERKVESDLKDLLKTLVAFANSVKPDHKAVILIGEKDDGTIQGVANPDNIQKRIRDECEKIYPSILWKSFVYQKEGKHCIRIEIEYSGDTPHFGGSTWIRKGSETIKANDEIFKNLIEIRLDIVRELSKWVGKEITIYGEQSTVPQMREENFPKPITRIFQHRWERENIDVKIIEVNRFWVTFETTQEPKSRQSEPLNKLTLTFDDVRNRLKVIVAY